MATSLVIYSADYLTGKAQQMTITGVNPNAANSDIATFAQMTAALSKDTYVSVERVDRANLDSDPKPQRTITSFKYAKSVDGANGYVAVPDDGVINIPVADVRSKKIPLIMKTPYDVAPQFRNFSSTSNATVASAEYHFLSYVDDAAAWNIVIATHYDFTSRQDVTAGVVSFTLHFDETDEFAAYNKPITINITEG